MRKKNLESQLEDTSKEHYLDEIKEVIEKATFTYVRQQQMLGLGHAILSGKPLIGNESFAVILADDLCVNKGKSALSQMIEIYNKYNCSVIAIEEIPMSSTQNYGIISGSLIDGTTDTYLVNDLIEKPISENAPSNLGIIGRYILTSDILTILEDIKPDEGGEIQITDALLVQAQQGRVIAYKIKGKRFDCGSVDGFIEATNHFAKKYKKNNL